MQFFFVQMPLFSSKFSTKKSGPRKASLSTAPDKAAEELSLDIGPIKLRLGDQEALFHKGEWVPESGPASGTHKENHKLRKRVQNLEDENRILKLKLEILLEMLTQVTADVHIKDKQLEQLQQVRTSSRRQRE